MKICGKSIIYIGVLMLLFVGIVLVYLKYNPTDSHWFPQCLVKQLTGWSCPACGFQRATHALLNGRFSEALSYNFFYVLGVPYFTVIVIAYGLKRANIAANLVDVLEHRILAMAYVYCFFVWFVVRNIFDI